MIKTHRKFIILLLCMFTISIISLSDRNNIVINNPNGNIIAPTNNPLVTAPNKPNPNNNNGNNGNNTNNNGQGANPQPSNDTKLDKGIDYMGGFVAKLIDTLFNMLVDAINRALSALSTMLLAITVILACLDIAFTMLSGVGNLSIVQALGSSIPRYITYIVVMTLLRVTNGKSLYMRLTIGDFTPDKLGSESFRGKSLMTGFLSLAQKFFPTNAVKVKLKAFSSAGTVVEGLLATPFKLIAQAIEMEGGISMVFLLLMGIAMLFFIMQLAGQIIMAIVEYMFVVGLSAIYLPFLANSATSSVGTKVITNIISKGISLTIQIGLIGVAITVLTLGATNNKETSMTLSKALELLLVTSIAVYVAGKGSTIARSILTGEGTGLKASEFITRGTKLLSNATKITLAVATGGALAYSKFLGKLGKGRQNIKNAGKDYNTAKGEYDKAEKSVLNPIFEKAKWFNKGSVKKSVNKAKDITKSMLQNAEQTAGLEQKVNNAKKLFGENSVEYKMAKRDLTQHTEVYNQLSSDREKIFDELNMKYSANIGADSMETLVAKEDHVNERKQVLDDAKESYAQDKSSFVNNNVLTSVGKFADRQYTRLNTALGGDKQELSNYFSARTQSDNRRHDYNTQREMTNLAKGKTSVASKALSLGKTVAGLGMYVVKSIVEE